MPFLSFLPYSSFLTFLPFSFSSFLPFFLPSFLPFFVELFLSLTGSFCFLFVCCSFHCIIAIWGARCNKPSKCVIASSWAEYIFGNCSRLGRLGSQRRQGPTLVHSCSDGWNRSIDINRTALGLSSQCHSTSSSERDFSPHLSFASQQRKHSNCWPENHAPKDRCAWSIEDTIRSMLEVITRSKWLKNASRVCQLWDH